MRCTFEVRSLVDDRNKAEIAKRYLLGQLAENDATRVEENYLVDDAAFEEMELAEDEIIDAYVHNELSSDESKYFSEHLLTSRRISQRVSFAKMLAAKTSRREISDADILPQENEEPRRVDETKAKTSWTEMFWPSSLSQRAAFASLILIVAIGGSALLIGWLRAREAAIRLSASRAELERKNEELTAENNKRALDTQRLTEALRQQQAENAKLNNEIERISNKPSQPPPLIPILLSVIGSRSGGADQRVRLPKEPAILELRIPLQEAKYDRYSVTITEPDGRVVSGPHELNARVKTLSLRLASTRFSPGDYIVTVSGVTSSGQAEEIEDYSFRLAPAKTRD